MLPAQAEEQSNPPHQLARRFAVAGVGSLVHDSSGARERPFIIGMMLNQALAEATSGVHFVGRLATYKYYNMDQTRRQPAAVERTLTA